MNVLFISCTQEEIFARRPAVIAKSNFCLAGDAPVTYSLA